MKFCCLYINPLLAVSLLLASTQTSLAENMPVTTQLTISNEQLDNLGVRFQTLGKQDQVVLASLPAISTVAPGQAENISLPFEGRLEEWQATTGNFITEKEPLALLHSHDVLDFFQSNQRLQQQASLCNQRLSDMRERNKSGLTSRLDLQEQQLQCQQLNDQKKLNAQILKHLPAQWQNASDADYALQAPESGWLITIKHQPGEHFMAGDSLAEFWPENALRLRLWVPQHLLHNLSIGQHLNISATQQQATVQSIGSVQNAAAQTEVWLKADNLIPGSSLIIDIPSKVSGWPTEAAARVRHNDKSWVFIRTPDGLQVTELQQFIAGNRGLLLQDMALENRAIAISGTAALKALWQSMESE